MKASLPYDGTSGMFVEEPRDVDLPHLEFLRWLAERGKLEHAPLGAPTGEYARAAGTRPPGRGAAAA